jgi:hypothetical protein
MNEILVVVSIDTEEDSWTPTRAPTVENIRRIPAFHGLLRSVGIRPTYFVAHSVTSVEWASSALAEAAGDGSGELGAHLHPWNTPPLDEIPGGRNTMLRNLPPQLQRAKLEVLTEQHRRVFGASPRTFRAGRFGMGEAALQALVDLGYEVDSSVTPWWDWSAYDDGPDFRGAPVAPYRASPARGLTLPAPDGEIAVLPLTVGFTRRPFGAWSAVHDRLTSTPLQALRLAGIAAKLGIYVKVVGSLEQASTRELLLLCRRAVQDGARYLHVFLHSSSLLPGLSPFTPTAEAVVRLERTVAEFAEKVHDLGSIRFVTASEAAASLAPPLASAAAAGGRHAMT